jgi:hypothetical protein
MDPRARTVRRLLPFVAVIAIATASVLPAAASAPPAPAAAPTVVEAPRPNGRTAATVAAPRPASERAPSVDTAAVQADRPAAVTPARISVPAAPVRFETKVLAPPRASGGGSTGAGGSTRPTSYRGTNHVWIPSLGINRDVSWYACSRNTALAHVVYRWGCAGSNNVYLMGHASSVFKPLHDAYVSGRLRKGMQVVYADGNGRTRTYAVSFWKVVAPDGDVGWAYAAQSRPSLTLQTCVGANSAYRLVVRLVAVG